MATSKKSIPAPSVVLPIGAGRVELTVTEDEIWLSDYADAEKRNFTLVIPRSELHGNESACQSVFAHHSNRKGAGRTLSQRVTAVRKFLTAQPPKVAGYWYEDPSFPAHGGPVVIVEE